MIVVSDTSPITNLAAIGQLRLLRDLFESLTIPDVVRCELNAGEIPWPGKREVYLAEWIHCLPCSREDLVKALQADLDGGEASAIALAIELKADLVLLDEREGRRLAQRLGLRVMGVVGVLIAAKRRGYVPRVAPHLEALRQTAGFYLSDALCGHALELVDE